MRIIYGLLVVIGFISCNAQSQRLQDWEEASFAMDPPAGEIRREQPVYRHPDSSEIISAVINAWMKVENGPYSYVSPRYEFKRLLIDENTVPEQFVPSVEGVKVALFDRSQADIGPGELIIRLDEFQENDSGAITVKFFHSGYRFIGGAWVTATAQSVDGEWIADIEGWFDP